MGLIMKNGVDYSGTANAEEISTQVDGSNAILQNVIDDLLGDMAAKESDVAINNHDIGDYILIGSKLYKVTAAITAGDVITVDTNVALTNVGEIVKNSAVLSNGTEIPDNADLDTYATPGVYYSPHSTRSATLNGTPSTDAGFKLIVMRSGYPGDSYKLQVAICAAHRTQNTVTNAVFIRTYYNGWTKWCKAYAYDMDVMVCYATTYDELYNTLLKMPLGRPATVYLSPAAANAISEDKINATYRGIVTRTSENTYDFVGSAGAGVSIWSLRVALAETGATVSNIYRSVMTSANSPMFKRVSYNAAYSGLAAGGVKTLTADDFDISTPSGYLPLSASYFTTGNADVLMRFLTVTNTKTTTSKNIMELRNVSTSAKSGTASVTINYVKTEALYG